MTFENSPSLDAYITSGKKPPHLNVVKIRVILYSVIGLLAIILIGVVFFYLATRPTELPVGGLDGCVVSTDGVPLVSMVEVGKHSKPTLSDGCFFIAAIPPGEYQINIKPSLGGEWTQTIQIISGQAVALGEITISR